MTNKILFAVILMVGLLTIQCSDQIVDTETEPDPPRNPQLEKQIVDASNEFAFNLFREVIASEADTNIMIAPFSVSFALGMVYNGANGQTETDIATTLGYSSLTSEEINQTYKSLAAILPNLDPKVIFEIANSMWIRNGFPILQDYIDINQEYFDAEVTSLDFDDGASVDIMNGWISDKTHGKIDKVLEPPISSDVVLFLINAIYFNGTWTYQFDEDKTKDSLFLQSDGNNVPCQLMIMNNRFNSTINDTFIGVDLPYGDSDFNMTILMPRKNKTMDDLLSIFSGDNFSSWLSEFQLDSFTLEFPKFKFSYGLELQDILATLGMSIAFNPGLADFSGITTAMQLFISKVIHKTFIQVDENGTEAAGVTVITMEGSIPGAIIVNDFTFNRPFVFVIHEKNSSAILFMGLVNNPVWEE